MGLRVAFLTAAAWPALYEDDRLAAAALTAHGVTVTPVVWTETSEAALERFDAVVMRSPWDWYRRRDEFRAFLSLLRRVRTRVFNPPALMVELADKAVLPRLATERGVRVVPTEVLAPDELSRVPALLEARGWRRAVLKPAFTANAYGARRFDAADVARAVAEASQVDAGGPWLLQPYVEAIADGELSFVFFDGVFSHAVRKRPKAGDWRVQHEHGGEARPYAASAADITEATELLARAAPGTLYARVDAVPYEGALHLMELEVVEPELFFRFEPGAAERFAAALLARLLPLPHRASGPG